MNRIFTLLLAAVVVGGALAPAYADPGSPQTTHFSTTMVAHLGTSDPRTGDMTIAIDESGNVTGTYRGTAPKNDSLYDKTVPVTGSIRGGQVHLVIGKNGELHVDGTMDQNGIVGTGSIGGQQLYDFVGSQATG